MEISINEYGPESTNDGLLTLDKFKLSLKTFYKNYITPFTQHYETVVIKLVLI